MKIGGKNIGDADKAARALLGIVFLGAYVGGYLAQPWQYIVLALGLAMVATAAYGTCPLYSLLGISTCKVTKKKPK